jgi:hypothetical protein
MFVEETISLEAVCLRCTTMTNNILWRELSTRPKMTFECPRSRHVGMHYRVLPCASLVANTITCMCLLQGPSITAHMLRYLADMETVYKQPPRPQTAHHTRPYSYHVSTSASRAAKPTRGLSCAWLATWTGNPQIDQRNGKGKGGGGGHIH